MLPNAIILVLVNAIVLRSSWKINISSTAWLKDVSVHWNRLKPKNLNLLNNKIRKLVMPHLNYKQEQL